MNRLLTVICLLTIPFLSNAQDSTSRHTVEIIIANSGVTKMINVFSQENYEIEPFTGLTYKYRMGWLSLRGAVLNTSKNFYIEQLDKNFLEQSRSILVGIQGQTNWRRFNVYGGVDVGANFLKIAFFNGSPSSTSRIIFENNYFNKYRGIEVTPFIGFACNVTPKISLSTEARIDTDRYFDTASEQLSPSSPDLPPNPFGWTPSFQWNLLSVHFKV